MPVNPVMALGVSAAQMWVRPETPKGCTEQEQWHRERIASECLIDIQVAKQKMTVYMDR